ncbi:hypothetical protein CRG98_040959 [Punica granatum]|uniref:Uncharacterized protein n=1 Tax=Punica granatum TaxID=22663 RepID=A0A2I0I3S1_PUNGR|nr:hypothetical protein CRG98_040959 [Punica granatum]
MTLKTGKSDIFIIVLSLWSKKVDRERPSHSKESTFGVKESEIPPLDVLGNASSRWVPSRAEALYKRTQENETTAPGKLTGSIEPQSTADWCFGGRPYAVPLRLVRRDLCCKALMMSMLAVKIGLNMSTKTLNPLPEKVFVPTNQGQAADCSNQFCNLPDEVLIQIPVSAPTEVCSGNTCGLWFLIFTSGILTYLRGRSSWALWEEPLLFARDLL